MANPECNSRGKIFRNSLKQMRREMVCHLDDNGGFCWFFVEKAGKFTNAA